MSYSIYAYIDIHICTCIKHVYDNSADIAFWLQQAIFFSIMSLCVGLSRKHIVEPYGDAGWSIALDELYRKASEMPDYRPEHDDYQAHYRFLGSLANAITLILAAQNTDQLFCAGVYADFFADIKVEVERLWPYLKTLLDAGRYRCLEVEIEPAAIAVYKWLVKPSGLRALLKFLARGHKAFYVATHNDKMMRAHISMFNITEGEFVETIVDAVLDERLSKLRKIDCIL